MHLIKLIKYSSLFIKFKKYNYVNKLKYIYNLIYIYIYCNLTFNEV